MKRLWQPKFGGLMMTNQIYQTSKKKMMLKGCKNNNKKLPLLNIASKTPNMSAFEGLEKNQLVNYSQ